MPGLLDPGDPNGILGRLYTAGANLTGGNVGPGGAIFNALTGLATGQRTDPTGVYQNNVNILLHTLEANGIPHEKAVLAVQNPDMLKAMIGQLNPTYTAGKLAPGETGYTMSSQGQMTPQFTSPQVINTPPGDQLTRIPGQIMQSPLAPPSGGQGPMQVPGQAPPIPPPVRPGPQTPIAASPLAPPAGAAGPMPIGGGAFGGGAPQVLVPGMTPEQLAAQRAAGAVQGKAAATLPQTLAPIDQMLGTIDALELHPGKDAFLSSGIGAMIAKAPGVAQAMPLLAPDANDYKIGIDQLKSQGRTLAIQSIKGTGSVSDKEGAAVQQGIARLEQAQTKPALREALNSLRNVLQAARANAESVAGGTGKYTSPIGPSAAQRRGSELKKSGMSDQQIYQQLHREGFY